MNLKIGFAVNNYQVDQKRHIHICQHGLVLMNDKIDMLRELHKLDSRKKLLLAYSSVMCSQLCNIVV